MNLNEIGAKVRKERIEKGLSQTVLSGLSGVDQATISNCERGNKIGALALDRILEALDLQLEMTVPRDFELK